jgi:hypothetical protein
MSPPASLRDDLYWLLGFVAMWIILSIPGYGFLSIWLKLREAVRATLQAFTDRVSNGRVRRKESATAVRQSLMQQMRLIEIDQTAANAWHQTLGTMLEGVRAGGAQIEKTRTAALEMTTKLERSAQGLRKLKLVSAVVPEMPTPDDALLHARRHRVAGSNLILALLLLIPIMAANAQLTGLVLREIIPPVQPLLGIPLAYVFALIIVIVEAAIGVLHSVEAERREESERKLTVSAIVFNLAAVGVVAIESLLYSTVQPDSQALRLPIGGSGFALVGAILGLAVFGLGRLAHSSLMTLRKDRTPRVIAKQLDTLKDSAENWNLVVNQFQPTQKSCLESFKRLVDLCRETAKSQGYATQQFASEVDKLGEASPAWARPVERQLSESEFSERESRAYFWITVSGIGTISLIVLCGALSFDVTALAGAAIGLGLATAAFAAGALGSQRTPDRPVWRLIWYALLISVVTVFTFASVRFLRESAGPYSLIELIPALAAFTAGIQVGPLVSLLRLPLLWLANRCINAILFGSLAVFWLISVLTAIIEYLAQLIAWPMVAILKAARAKRERGSHATIA